jgi:hypothetical protein
MTAKTHPKNRLWSRKETSSQVGIPFEVWLPSVDTLRNLFCAPTVEMTITVDRLAQDRYAIY